MVRHRRESLGHERLRRLLSSHAREYRLNHVEPLFLYLLIDRLLCTRRFSWILRGFVKQLICGPEKLFKFGRGQVGRLRELLELLLGQGQLL